MGNKFKFSFILVTCALPTRHEEAVASGHLFQRHRAPVSELCTIVYVKKVMYHSRATFKEALKQVICFSK